METHGINGLVVDNENGIFYELPCIVKAPYPYLRDTVNYVIEYTELSSEKIIVLMNPQAAQGDSLQRYAYINYKNASFNPRAPANWWPPMNEVLTIPVHEFPYGSFEAGTETGGVEFYYL